MQSRTNKRRAIPANQLTLREAADRIGCGYRHARRLVAQGKLKAEIVGYRVDGVPIWATTPEAITAFKRRRGT